MTVHLNELIEYEKLEFLGMTEGGIANLIHNPPQDYFVLELPKHHGIVYIDAYCIESDTELTITAREESIGTIIGKRGKNIKFLLDQIKRVHPKCTLRRINIDRASNDS